MYIFRVIMLNLILVNFLCMGDISVSFISDYFKNKNIDSLTILSCWDLNRKASVMYELGNKGFTVSYSIMSVKDFPIFRSGVLLDLTCENDLKFFFDRISNLKLFGPHTEWLLVDTVSSQNITGIEYIENSYILPGSSVILYKKYNISFIYYDIYKSSVEKPLKLNIIDSPKFIKQDRSNFEEALLHSGTVLLVPDRFKGWEDLENPELDTWSKLHYPIIKNLAYQLNFKYTMIVENGYGWKENGSFIGLMGFLQREEIQFGAAGLLMRDDRREIVDFTTDTFELRTAIIFKRPPLSTVSNIYLLPFSKNVWVFCGLISILAILFLCLELISYKYLGNIYPFQKPASIADIGTSILGFVCQQGSELYPESYPARITTFIFSLSAIFIYTSYSANIVALLQSTSSDINSLVALSKSPLSVKIEKQIYNHLLFREVSDKNVEMLLKKKVSPQGEKAFCSIKEGIAYLRTGHYAFNVEVNPGYKIISETFEEHEKCDLSELRLFFMPKLSVPVIKKSGYREIFAQKLSWQREAGIFKRFEKIRLAQRPSCSTKRGGYRAVGFTDFLPAVLALLYGISISFCLFILEVILTYRKRFRCRKTNVNLLKNNMLTRLKKF